MSASQSEPHLADANMRKREGFVLVKLTGSTAGDSGSTGAGGAGGAGNDTFRPGHHGGFILSLFPSN